jgi:hypothetical protein
LLRCYYHFVRSYRALNLVGKSGHQPSKLG